jgi:hypothetical protein
VVFFPPEINCLSLFPHYFLFAHTLLLSFMTLSFGFKGLNLLERVQGSKLGNKV